MRKHKKFIIHIGTTAALSIFAVIAISPIILLFTGTFMGTQEIKGYIAPVLGSGDGYAKWQLLPQYPTLRNVVELFLDSPEFFQMFWNSVKITGGILIGQIVFGIPAAWGLARYEFRGKRQIYLCYVVLMMMPFQVTMLSEYLVLDRMGLMDTLAAVILPGVFSTFPPFIMYRFFAELPEALIEAARVDGAGELTIFRMVGLLVGKSGILSALILQFLECQSMVERPMTFLKTKELWPLTLYLPEIDLERAGFALCASFFTMLPVLCVFVCGQDYLEQGIAASAIKE